jgi:hypothetical protein
MRDTGLKTDVVATKRRRPRKLIIGSVEILQAAGATSHTAAAGCGGLRRAAAGCGGLRRAAAGSE